MGAQMFDRILISYASAAAFFCLLLALELWKPRDALPQRESRQRAILFTFVFITCSAVLTGLLSLAFGRMQFEPMFAVPGILGAIIAAFAGDFFYYWFHRAQHSIPWLWRLHAVHHSVEELGAGAGYHHVSETPLKALLYAAPLSFFISPNVGVVALILAFHGNYIHSATRLNFGWFAWVVADNRTHRIHHSLESKHFGKNFGALTMLWDKLFGTAYFPKANEWPGVGLSGRPEPRTILEYLTTLRAPPRTKTQPQLP